MSGKVISRFIVAFGLAAAFATAAAGDSFAGPKGALRLPSGSNIPVPTEKPMDTDEAAAEIEEKKPVEGDAADVRSLSFYNTHTQERLSVIFKRAGVYDDDGMLKISTFLRDHRRKGAVSIRDMNPELMDLLADIRDELLRRHPGREIVFDIVSGYRTPETNKKLKNTKGRGGQADNSAHTRAEAIDIRVQGIKRSELRDVAWCLGYGGVGDYPKQDFVHVDVWKKKTRDKNFPGGERMRVWGWYPKADMCGPQA